MVTIDLVTGFLGSGKTTLILKYVKHLIKNGDRVGVLEYDYGAVNVDMMLLGSLRGESCELEMVAAGCDKDCLKRRFKTKLISMAMSGYTRVVVEPSGIFDMDDFFDCLREEPLDRFYSIGSVITVVSCKLENNLYPQADFILASQVAGAGMIVLSRTQDSTEEEIAGVKKHIDRALELIRCKMDMSDKYFEKNWCDLSDHDFEAIKNSGYKVNDYVKYISGHNDDTFKSLCFLKPGISLDNIGEKVHSLFSDETFGKIWRVKGFVRGNENYYQINATKTDMLVEKIDEGQDVLIVIGSDLDEKLISDFISN